MKRTRGLRWLLGFVLVLLVGGGIAFFFFHDRWEATPLSQPTFDGPSTRLEQTVIIPTLDTPLPEGKSAVWCASFQLAWNELKDKVVKEPIRLTGAEEVARRLNESPVRSEDLTPDLYYANAGRVKEGITSQIREDMERRFPNVALPDWDEKTEVVAYAYLQAAIPFSMPYAESQLVFQDSSGQETRVRGFGSGPHKAALEKPLSRQIEVLFFAGDPFRPTEFALDLCKQSTPHQVGVACISRPGTLQEAFAEIQKRSGKDLGVVGLSVEHFGVELAVPTMFWKIEHHFSDLMGPDRRFENPTMKGLFLGEAFKADQYKLDKNGALLASEADVKGKKGGPPAFYLDRPYLIWLKKRDAENPFFAMWVDNAELMVR